jgi:hypothetical protein
MNIHMEGDFGSLFGKKSSYTHVSDFEWLQNYDRWKFIIKDKDCVKGLE